MKASSFIIKHGFYLIPVIIFLLTGIVFLGLYSKEAIHLTLNGWHSPFFDQFFKFMTYLGDGIMLVPAALITIFVRWRYLVGLCIAALLTLCIVGILKHGVFPGVPRPVKVFAALHEKLYLVPGVKMNQINSFPSGHTTTAFACFGLLGLVVRSHWGQFLSFLMAALVGYSRIYLSEHFLRDVVAGAFLGTIIAIISYWLMNRIQAEWAEARLSLRKRK